VQTLTRLGDVVAGKKTGRESDAENIVVIAAVALQEVAAATVYESRATAARKRSIEL
jgi:hypothetical protein